MEPTFHQFRVEPPVSEAKSFDEQPDTGQSSSIQLQPGSKKAPYGTGDSDEYSLSFESMAAFEAWRQKEEEEKVVEFVKNDRHVSKSVPPRFKEHTKLVCL